MAYNEGAKQPKEAKGLVDLVAEVVGLSAEARGRLQAALLRAGKEPQQESRPMADNRLDDLAEQLQDARENLQALIGMVEKELGAKL